MFPIIFSSDQFCKWFSSYFVFCRSVSVITRPSQLNYCFGSENAQNLYVGREIYVICPQLKIFMLAEKICHLSTTQNMYVGIKIYVICLQLKYVGMTMHVNTLTSIYLVILYVKYTLKHTLYRHHF